MNEVLGCLHIGFTGFSLTWGMDIHLFYESKGLNDRLILHLKCV